MASKKKTLKEEELSLLKTGESKVAGFFSEFKEFAIKGNVIDLAIGVIIGTAFNNIVQSIVKDIILPPIGFITGRVDFTNLYWNISGTNYPTLADAQKAGAAVVTYGVFLNNLINFLIVAFVIFLVVRQINRMKRKDDKKEVTSPSTKNCPYCYSSINIKAKKCPNCTSNLPEVDAKKTVIKSK